MELNNPLWPTLHGGYQIPYNASIPLQELYTQKGWAQREDVLAEFWENLHHQGDVGLASYMALSHLVALYIENRSLEWNIPSLCLVIEHCRLSGKNLALPIEYHKDYFDALKRLEAYFLERFKQIEDPTTLRIALAHFATINGQSKLGRAIENMDEDVIDEFLEQF